MAAPGHFSYSGSSSYRKNFDRDVHADTGIFNRLKTQFLNVISTSGPGADSWTPFVVNPALAAVNDNYYATISAAIAAAVAAGADCEHTAVIYVVPGTYGSFTIANEGIIVRGANSNLQTATTNTAFGLTERLPSTRIEGTITISPDATSGTVCCGIENLYCIQAGVATSNVTLTGSSNGANSGNEFRIVSCTIENTGTGSAFSCASGDAFINISESFLGTYDNGSAAVNLVGSGGCHIRRSTISSGGAFDNPATFADSALTYDHHNLTLADSTRVNGLITLNNTSGALRVITIQNIIQRGRMIATSADPNDITIEAIDNILDISDLAVVGNYADLTNCPSCLFLDNSFIFNAAFGGGPYLTLNAGTSVNSEGNFFSPTGGPPTSAGMTGGTGPL